MTWPPQLAPGVIAVRAGDETVVWVETTGALHLLDPVATAVLELLDGERPLTELAILLADRFGAEAERVAADVHRLLLELNAAKVLS